MQDLDSWMHRDKSGLVLRGWRTAPRGLPVIFFLHGNGLCAMAYWPMLRHLREQFDLVLLDAPGHGLSDPVESFQGWQQNASFCLAAWMSLREEYRRVRRHVVGHSFGGVLSTYMLAQNPQCFDSAVLLDPVYFPPSMLLAGRLISVFGLLKYAEPARSTAKRRDRWPSTDAVREHLRSKPVYARWESDCFEAYLQHGFRACDDGVGCDCACNRALEAEIFSTLPFSLPRAIAAVITPCIICSGDRSYGFVVKGLPKYCSGHQHIEHREIPGSHNFMLEKPADTALLVQKAIDQLD